MVQCETCKVWQHGLCMGYTSEDQVHDDDYYCELCKPDMHAELLKYAPVPHPDDLYPEFSLESWHGNRGRRHRAPDKIPMLLREFRDLIPLLTFLNNRHPRGGTP